MTFIMASKRVVYSSGDAAKLLRISRERVRQLVAAGRLPPLAVTVGGFLLFAADDVFRLRDERERRRERRMKARAG
jgi:excisionase family DNA binding protein